MTFGQFRFNLTRMFAGLDPDTIDLAVNARIERIYRHHRWKALEEDWTIQTTPLYNAGTVNLTQGSNAVTGVGTAFTNSMTGLGFLAPQGNEQYTFTYGSATSGTLDRPYEQATGTALAYAIFQTLYAMPADFGSPCDGRNERLPGEIVYWDRTKLNQVAPSRTQWGEPAVWCEATPVEDPSHNITRYAELYPIPQWSAAYFFRYLKTWTYFVDGDTAKLIPAWISIPCLTDACRAELTKGAEKAVYETLYEKGLQEMLREDARRRGPQVLRMATQFTRHRLSRILNYYKPITLP